MHIWLLAVVACGGATGEPEGVGGKPATTGTTNGGGAGGRGGDMGQSQAGGKPLVKSCSSSIPCPSGYVCGADNYCKIANRPGQVACGVSVKLRGALDFVFTDRRCGGGFATRNGATLIFGALAEEDELRFEGFDSTAMAQLTSLPGKFSFRKDKTEWNTAKNACIVTMTIEAAQIPSSFSNPVRVSGHFSCASPAVAEDNPQSQIEIDEFDFIGVVPLNGPL